MTKTFKQLCEEKGFTTYIDEDISLPEKQTYEEPIEYINFGKYVSAGELQEEYETRGVVPVDPYTILESIDENLEEKRHYIGTQWKDANGNYCSAFFNRWCRGRRVRVRRHDDGWYGPWWFPVVRKTAFNKPKTALPVGEEESIKARLLPQIDESEGCWNWNGVVSKGYGLIKIHSRSVRVHRLMYEVFIGPIPEGFVIDHLCKNKKCVNPDHLEAVTSRENTLRGDGITAKQARQKMCMRGHELPKFRSGRRQCKKCAKDRKRNGVTKIL